MNGRHKPDMGRSESVAVKPEEYAVARSKERRTFGMASCYQHTAGPGVDADVVS